MNVNIKAEDLQVGDIYKGRKVVMVDKDAGNVVLADFDTGAPKAFVKTSDLLVDRDIKQIEGEAKF